jgi:hypothetical protein
VYHLTPNGWVAGSFKGDVVGGANEVPIPPDRVLSVSCYDELSSAFSKPYYHDRVIWESSDKKLVAELKAKWGDRPDWFGYKMMKS